MICDTLDVGMIRRFIRGWKMAQKTPVLDIKKGDNFTDRGGQIYTAHTDAIPYAGPYPGSALIEVTYTTRRGKETREQMAFFMDVEVGQ